MFENPRRGSQARNFTTNVSKILDLKSSSEQNFSENWRWVPPVRDCDGRNICLLLLSSKLISHHGIKGRASPTSTKVSIFAWDCVQMNFFAWFCCLFFWPNVGHAPKLCVYMYANRKKCERNYRNSSHDPQNPTKLQVGQPIGLWGWVMRASVWT